MDLNLVRLFVEVADCGGFSAAARKLDLQRSSVSRGIGTLERTLDVQLFSRSTRHVVLTSAGRALYAKVAPAFAAIEEGMTQLPERGEEPSGSLLLTAPQDFSTAVLPDVLAGFTQRFAKVEVRVHFTNRIVDLMSEGFDAALRPSAGDQPDSPLVSLRLGKISVQIYASPEYLARAGTPRTYAQALEHQWVVGPGDPHRADGPRPRRVAVTGDDMMFSFECAKRGLGLAALPSFLAGDAILAGRLVLVLAPERDLFLCLVHPPLQHYPRKLSAFRDYLVEYFRRHPLESPEAPPT